MKSKGLKRNYALAAIVFITVIVLIIINSFAIDFYSNNNAAKAVMGNASTIIDDPAKADITTVIIPEISKTISIGEKNADSFLTSHIVSLVIVTIAMFVACLGGWGHFKKREKAGFFLISSSFVLLTAGFFITVGLSFTMWRGYEDANDGLKNLSNLIKQIKGIAPKAPLPNIPSELNASGNAAFIAFPITLSFYLVSFVAFAPIAVTYVKKAFLK